MDPMWIIVWFFVFLVIFAGILDRRLANMESRMSMKIAEMHVETIKQISEIIKISRN